MVIIRFVDRECCGMGHGSGVAHRVTFAERSELERRVRAGETHGAAAAAVGCSAKSVQRLLATMGGLKSRAKPRSSLRLSLAEREELSRGLLGGDSRRLIAARKRELPRTEIRGADPAQRSQPLPAVTPASPSRPSASRAARAPRAPAPARGGDPTAPSPSAVCGPSFPATSRAVAPT